MQLNVAEKKAPIFTHEGAKAAHITPFAQLRRSVLTTMLWEDQFYEDGKSIAERIAELVPKCDASDVMALAIEARHEMKLRHVPLLIARAMAGLPDHKKLVAHTLEAIIDRPDEITEFTHLCLTTGMTKTLTRQVKKGLGAAFGKFNEYALGKYDRDGPVKLRDALFLSHAKPEDAKKRWTKAERAAKKRRALAPKETLFRKIVDKELETPDTWEVQLSGGAGKKETFERLIAEKKLGALALLRNLRNMKESGVPRETVAEALENIKVERVLPFRFIAAARVVPEWEDLIEPAMLKCLEGRDKLPGRTILLIDISGSMDGAISNKSDLRRVDAACGLAILARELCEDVLVATFSERLVSVAPRRGFALRDAILQSQPHSGTLLGAAVAGLRQEPRDRVIIITDEQSADTVPPPLGIGYVINVAAYKNGVGYGEWNHLDGWSEAVFDYILQSEAEVVV